MMNKRLKSFYMTFFISTLIFGITGCSNKTKDSPDDAQSPTEYSVIEKPTEIAVPTDIPQAIPDISAVEIVEAYTMTPEVDDVKNFTSEDIAEDKPSSTLAVKEFELYPLDNEPLNNYYMDNMNFLNRFYWKHNSDYAYTSCCLNKEQQDGTLKDTEITWNSDADKIINPVSSAKDLRIMSEWIDENSGDFYFIVCNVGLLKSPTFLYGIHPDGELFVNIQLEDYLVMDKIDLNMYALGYYINYIGQDKGIAYFEYSDDSQYAVVYYDMNKNCFIKQIFTGYIVQGIIDGKYVGLSERVMPDPVVGEDGELIIDEFAGPSSKYIIIGSIPEGEKSTVAKGNTMLIGKSDIQHVYNLPEYLDITVNGNYLYMITPAQYQRLIPGDDSWEMLADVSQITKHVNGGLYLNDLIVKDTHTFSLVFYEDCGAGYYLNGFHVE